MFVCVSVVWWSFANEHSRRVKRSRVMIQDQTALTDELETNFTSAWCPRPHDEQRSLWRHQSVILKQKPKIKPRLTHDCSVTTSVLPPAHLLPANSTAALVTVVSAQQHHSIYSMSTEHQPQHRLYTCGLVRRAYRILLRVKITLNIKSLRTTRSLL